MKSRFNNNNNVFGWTKEWCFKNRWLLFWPAYISGCMSRYQLENEKIIAVVFRNSQKLNDAGCQPHPPPPLPGVGGHPDIFHPRTPSGTVEWVCLLCHPDSLHPQTPSGTVECALPATLSCQLTHGFCSEALRIYILTFLHVGGTMWTHSLMASKQQVHSLVACTEWN